MVAADCLRAGMKADPEIRRLILDPGTAGTHANAQVGRTLAKGSTPCALESQPATSLFRSDSPAVVTEAAGAVPRRGETVRATVFVEAEDGFGSGFIVHPDGLVVTACHVLDGQTASPEGHHPSSTTAARAPPLLMRAHRPLDFALLWLDKPDKYPALRCGRLASNHRYAETVLAVGHPGVGSILRQGRALKNTVTTGIVAESSLHISAAWNGFR